MPQSPTALLSGSASLGAGDVEGSPFTASNLVCLSHAQREHFVLFFACGMVSYHSSHRGVASTRVGLAMESRDPGTGKGKAKAVAVAVGVGVEDNRRADGQRRSASAPWSVSSAKATFSEYAQPMAELAALKGEVHKHKRVQRESAS